MVLQEDGKTREGNKFMIVEVLLVTKCQRHSATSALPFKYCYGKKQNRP